MGKWRVTFWYQENQKCVTAFISQSYCFPSGRSEIKYSLSWFQTFAVFWKFYSEFRRRGITQKKAHIQYSLLLVHSTAIKHILIRVLLGPAWCKLFCAVFITLFALHVSDVVHIHPQERYKMMMHGNTKIKYILIFYLGDVFLLFSTFAEGNFIHLPTRSTRPAKQHITYFI